MVGEFGMGIALDAEGAPPIALPTTDYALSDTTRRDVDLAAMMLARDAHRRARALLAENRECLDDLAANALERETLSREDLDEIFAAHVLDETAAEVAAEPDAPSPRAPRGSLPRTLTTATGEDHYFPPGRSIARMVHGERSVGLLYGQRALLIGALEPLTYTGTMLSTRAANKPFKRLARTAKIQETVFLGTRAEADEVLAGVHALHETIKGELPEAAGVHPAGTAYSAFDPELMLWTLAVIADSGRAMYEAMVRPLSEEERESLWQDYVLFGELFRLPRAEMPRHLPRVRGLVRGQARLTRPAGDRARPRDGAAGRLPAAGAGRRPRQPRDPEPLHQGDAAAAGAGDLRDPLERRPRALLPGDGRRPPPRPARLPLLGSPRPQRLLLRPGHPRRAAARRHGHAGAAGRLSAGSSGGRYSRTWQGRRNVPDRKVPSLKRNWPRA